MGKTTISTENTNLPAPRWFRRLKKAMTILFDAAIVISLYYGYTENSTEILVARVAYSALVNSIEALLANGEVYAPSETSMGKR
jgi:hypothetical protein